MKKIKGMILLIVALILSSLLLNSAFVYADKIEGKYIALSLVNQDPDPAISGSIVEVRLGVENKGDTPVDNLIIELVPEYPFSMVPGVSKIQNVGTIKSYQTEDNMKIVKFNIKIDRDANAANYGLKVKFYEKGNEDSAQITSLSLDIGSQESAEVIYIDKSTLIPGRQTDLMFTINNVGNAPLRDLTFSWKNEDKVVLPVGSDNTKYIKYIDIGDSAELRYKVIADTNAIPGLYELALSLSYDDPISRNNTKISTIAGVYVGGSTDFEVSYSESSAGETSFSIANIGSNPAYSVSIIVPEQEGWKTTGSSSMIIGNLNNGDYTVASFNLQPKQTKQSAVTAKDKSASAKNTGKVKNTGNQEDVIEFDFGSKSKEQDTVLIQVAYTDTMGERNIVEKEVKVNSQSMVPIVSADGTTVVGPAAFRGARAVQQQSFFSKYKWYIIGLVILLVVAVFYSKYKKKKLINPKFKFKDLFKYK
ncbi:MAG: COG1361 S-layer family protein [Candidatus Woesearchaeota archaeon]